MKRIKRKKFEGVTLYDITPNDDTAMTVTVCNGFFSKAVPRVFVHANMPMLKLERANLANVLKSMRKEERKNNES